MALEENIPRPALKSLQAELRSLIHRSPEGLCRVLRCNDISQLARPAETPAPEATLEKTSTPPKP